jgi:hypothetical protein
MTVVLPVSHVDADLARKLVVWMEEIDTGSYPERTIILFLTKKVEHLFEELAAPLRKVFGTVLKEIQKVEVEVGWPGSPNAIFREVAMFIANHPVLHKQPWYFFEADNTPTSSKWLTAFEEEYAKGGKSYMGYLQPTLYSDGDRIVETSPHMVGTGVYPGDFCRRSLLFKFPSKDPFDVYHLGEIVGDMHEVNKLIQHNWGTHSYRDHRGRIVCEGTKLPDYFAKTVRDKALVVHGCKDGSLIDALREKISKRTKKEPKA